MQRYNNDPHGTTEEEVLTGSQHTTKVIRKYINIRKRMQALKEVLLTAFTVDADKCKRDRICVEECPRRVIEMKSKERPPSPTADFEQSCLRCGHCVAVCPGGAFKLSWMAPEDCLPIKKALKLNNDQAEQFLRVRRSIRNFKDQKVDRRVLERVLEMGGHAASAKNEQPWHWLVVEDTAEVQRLAGLVVDWMHVMIKKYRADAMRRGFPAIVAAWAIGKDRVCRDAPHVIVAHADNRWPFGSEDCANALTYLDLYAHHLGLGTCWGGYFYTAANNYPPLFEALGLPANHRVCGAMMVGYPVWTYHRCPPRKLLRVRWK